MINGVHAIIFSQQAEEVRAFFKNVLGFASADAGEGWLLFAPPPAEMAVHPDETDHHELYLMCDNLIATVEGLKGKGVEFAQPISDQGWGMVTSIRLPGGAELGLYEPRHPTAPAAVASARGGRIGVP